MITIKLTGVEDLLASLKGMRRQIPYAIANGMNEVARKVKQIEEVKMPRVFKSPTPFTLKSLRMTPAKAPGKLIASVWFKDPPNLSQKDHYLVPQVDGGSRPLKPYEMGLGGRFTTPGKGLKLDQYGNLGRGQLTKILSQSGSFRESGFKMNRTRKGGKIGDMFMLTQKRGKMLPGIYERVTSAAQFTKTTKAITGSRKKNHSGALKSALKKMSPRGIKPVLIFPSKAPRYSKRFDFYGIAQKMIDMTLRPEMENAINREIQNEMAYRARKGL